MAFVWRWLNSKGQWPLKAQTRDIGFWGQPTCSANGLSPPTACDMPPQSNWDKGSRLIGVTRGSHGKISLGPALTPTLQLPSDPVLPGVTAPLAAGYRPPCPFTAGVGAHFPPYGSSPACTLWGTALSLHPFASAKATNSLCSAFSTGFGMRF